MRTLTAPAALQAARPSARPTYLLQIDFTAPTAKTLYLADAWYKVSGQEFLPMVADWGTLEQALNMLDVGGAPATAELTFFNRKPIEGETRLSDLIRTASNTTNAWEWALAKVTVGQLFAGLGGGDVVILGVFYLEDPTDIGDETLTVRMSDESLRIESQMRLGVITRDIWPQCDIEAIGERRRAIIGSVANVPTQPIFVGRTTTLVAAINTTDTAIPVADQGVSAGVFPISVMIDAEIILIPNASFTGCTRGYGGGGSVPAAHANGATVYPVFTEYDYLVGEHDANFKHTSVSNIRVNGRPAATGPTVISDDQYIWIKFDYHGLADFFIEPVQGKKVVTSGSIHPAVTNPLGDTAFTPSLGAMASEADVSHVTGHITFNVSLIAGQWNGHASQLWAGAVGTGQLLFDAVAPGNVNGSATFDIGPELFNMPIIHHVRIIGGGPGTNDLNIVITISEYTATVSVNAPGDTSSGGARFIGDVTCDVVGIKDDASGTISGTPGLLLENPADVTRYMLRQLFGVTNFGSTWAATRASLASASYKWAAVLEYAAFSQWRRRLGEQARSALYLEAGAWQYKFLASAPAADITLDYRRDVWDGLPARVSRTARTDVRNSLTVKSQRDPVSGDYRRATTVEDLTQPGFTTALADDLELDLVRDVTTADALGAYWLAWRKRQRFALELVTWWNALAVEAIDHFALTNHPVLAAHGGAALVFRIVNKSYLLGDENPGRIRVRGVEV